MSGRGAITSRFELLWPGGFTTFLSTAYLRRRLYDALDTAIKTDASLGAQSARCPHGAMSGRSGAPYRERPQPSLRRRRVRCGDRLRRRNARPGAAGTPCSAGRGASQRRRAHPSRYVSDSCGPSVVRGCFEPSVRSARPAFASARLVRLSLRYRSVLRGAPIGPGRAPPLKEANEHDHGEQRDRSTLRSRRQDRGTAADHGHLPELRQGSRGRASVHSCAKAGCCSTQNSRRRRRSVLCARRHTPTPPAKRVGSLGAGHGQPNKRRAWSRIADDCPRRDVTSSGRHHSVAAPPRTGPLP
jgi:hypothetical protein